MRQIFQNLKTGKIEIAEVPCSQVESGSLFIKTIVTLISAGTERMILEFSKAGYLSKAKSQSDKVKQVLDKIKTDGLLHTVEAVRAKLDQPLPLGYCNVGTVIDGGFKLKDLGFKKGDRVVSNGAHADYVCVPRNLCARVPDKVSDEEAAFAVVGAIGLQGIRLAQPTLGEAFVVIGLGLLGQLTAQLLMTHGCGVIGIDLDAAKCNLARQLGVETVDLSRGEEPVDAAKSFSRGRGVDGVLITAATKSSEPVRQAAQMCRKRGRIVLVGVTGLQLRRSDFYEKELSFQVSCSYGPGRYDLEYEEKGHDYPIGYVRWTEQRNFEAVLDLIVAGKLNVKPLITHHFPLEMAAKAYELILGKKEPYLGIILTYGEKSYNSYDLSSNERQKASDRTIKLKKSTLKTSSLKPNTPVIGLIGAGNFTAQVLLPALQKTGALLKRIASSGGISGTHLGKKFGFEESTTDLKSIFEDQEINTVFITTRHDTHARFVLEALKAGQHVFVEKPLCLTSQELDEIIAVYNSLPATRNFQLIMVGFNRRFAPHIVKMKKMLNNLREPKALIMSVNAGMIPPDHWTQDPAIGGGRIIGEACHFIDLLKYLVGSKIVSSEMTRLRSGVRDTASIQLSFGDGSIGTIHYLTNGSKKFPKERLEVFCGGKILQLNNFKVLRGYGWKGFRKMKLWRQDKGHEAEVKCFVEAVKIKRVAPIQFEDIVEVTRTTIELATKEHR